MNIFIWILFIFVAIISFLPLTRIKAFNLSDKYKNFKYVSIFLFVWSIITLFTYVAETPQLVYWFTLSIYPLIYLLTVLLFMAFMRYLGRKVHHLFHIGFMVLFVLEIIAVITNPIHQGLIDVAYDEALTFEIFLAVPHGPIFLYHTLICYFILIYVGGMILKTLYANIKKDQDIIPFLLMLIGMIVGIILNMIHVFVYPFVLDPTYVAFVVLISTLYFILYIRDIKIILTLNKNNFILDNLREMYVICNHHQVVEEVSEEFKRKFDLIFEEGMTFETLMKLIVSKAIVYQDPKILNNQFDESKLYLHMQQKPIEIPLFKYSGTFYLFYDETVNQQYINDINYVKQHDLMTHLYNRNYFEEFKTLIDESDHTYTIVMFDLDCLKLYNDYLGHDVGDDIIIRFAKQLKNASKESNMTPIRMGGDEFILIALNPSIDEVDKAITFIKQVSDEQKTENPIIFSYGVASKEKAHQRLEKVISKADQMMYQMKQSQLKQKSALKTALEHKNKGM